MRFLVNEMKLGKTALVNHLAQLMEVKLIKKPSHGSYVLADDAHDLLYAIIGVYLNSKLCDYQIKRSVYTTYSRSYQRVNPVRKKLVKKPSFFEPCCISYLGAMKGVLTALGEKIDITSLGGYSGYIFIVNVARERLCPSGITALSKKMSKEINQGIKEISGWKFKRLGDNEPYPNSDPLDDIDKNRALLLYNQIKAEINFLDRPIILWGLGIPEYGIVNGYEGNSYFCSTYRHTMNVPETPLHYETLQAPGSLHAYSFIEKTKTETGAREAIHRAVNFARGEYQETGYIVGPEAFEEWANVLEKGPIDEMSYHGNSHIGNCQLEAKRLAVNFLLNLVTKNGVKKPHVKYLEQTAKKYEETSNFLTKFTKLFPYALEGEMEYDKRRKGALLLKKIVPCEKLVIRALENAVISWQ